MALPGDVTTFNLTFGHATNGYTDAVGAVALPGTKAKLFPVDLVTGKRLNVTHVTSGQVIIPKSVDVTIDDQGKATVGPLPHTDNPTLSPVGFGYRVEWQVASGRLRAAPDDKTIAVPASSGATVDFDLVDVAEAVPGVLVPVITGATGATGATGPTGPQGVPGVADDASVAALFATAGTLTRTASEAVFPLFPDVGLVPPQVLVKDTFTRANNTSSMGTAETGQAWVFTGTTGAEAGILNNAAYLRASGGGLRHSVIDCGKRDVTVTLDVTITTKIGTALRQLDPTNALGLTFDPVAGLLIYSINDGTHTTRATVPITLTAGAHRLATRIDGDANATFIQAYIDGVLVHTHSLNTADATKFANGTQHGIKWSVPPDAGATRAESIQITTPLLPTDKALREWAASESYEVATAAALDTDGFAPSAVVRWPDGAPGVYTLVAKKIDAAYKAVDAYTLTHISAGRKVTQAAPTRAATGNITAKPALTVGALA